MLESIHPLSPRLCLPYRPASCRREMILVYILSADTSQDIALGAGHRWRYTGYSFELFYVSNQYIFQPRYILKLTLLDDLCVK
jgi:hypothetical protein